MSAKMRAKIVLTLEEALKALREEKFDFAIALHDADKIAPKHDYRRKPHATLLVAQPKLAVIFEYDPVLRPRLDPISGYEAFRLKSFETLAISGGYTPQEHILTWVFPETEMVGQGQWRYDERENKVIPAAAIKKAKEQEWILSLSRQELADKFFALLKQAQTANPAFFSDWMAKCLIRMTRLGWRDDLVEEALGISEDEQKQLISQARRLRILEYLQIMRQENNAKLFSITIRELTNKIIQREHSCNKMSNNNIDDGEEVKSDELEQCLKELGTDSKELEELDRRAYRNLALLFLAEVRESNDNNWVNRCAKIIEYAALAGCTIEELGTSDEELAKCKKKITKDSIRIWLKESRKRDYFGWGEPDINDYWLMVDRAGYSSEEKIIIDGQLVDLIKWMFRCKALKHLEGMRQGLDGLGSNTKNILWQAWAAGTTLEDLGTSELELDKLSDTAGKHQASKWLAECLERLREASYPEEIISYSDSIRTDTKKLGCSLEDLGTSEKELRDYEQKAHFEKAKSLLKTIRNPDFDAPHFVDGFWSELEQSSQTLENLGVQQEEISRLDTQICKRAALKSLSELHRGAHYTLWGLSNLRRHIARSNCRLEELGSSEEEILNWERAAHSVQARYWLEKARTLPNSCQYCLEIFQNHLEKSSYNFSGIGTTQEEINKLKTAI